MKAINKYLLFTAQSTNINASGVTIQSAVYNALAYDIEHVQELADEAGIDISDCEIELDRKNVRDQLGRPYEPIFKGE